VRVAHARPVLFTLFAAAIVAAGSTSGPAQQVIPPAPIALRSDGLVVTVQSAASVDITADRVMLVDTIGCPDRGPQCDMAETLRKAEVDLMDAGLDRGIITTEWSASSTPSHGAQGRLFVILAHPQAATVEMTRQHILHAAYSSRFGDVVRDAKVYAALDDCDASVAEVRKRARSNARGTARQLATLAGSTLEATPAELVLERATLPDGVLCGRAVMPGPHDAPVGVEPSEAAVVHMTERIEQTYRGSKAAPVSVPDSGLARYMTSDVDPAPIGLAQARCTLPAGTGLVFTTGAATRALAFASGMHPNALALRIAALRAREAATDVGSTAGAPEVIVAYPGERGDAIVAVGFAFAPVPFVTPKWTAPPGRDAQPRTISGAGSSDRFRQAEPPIRLGQEARSAVGAVDLPPDGEQLAITLHFNTADAPAQRTAAVTLAATLKPLGIVCCIGVSTGADSLRLYAEVPKPTRERNAASVAAIDNTAHAMGATALIASRLRITDCLAADRAARRFTLALLEAKLPQPRTLVSLVDPDTRFTDGMCGVRFDARAFDDDASVWPDASTPPFDPSAPLVITVTGRLTADFTAATPPAR
jgi:hypothetical protein